MSHVHKHLSATDVARANILVFDKSSEILDRLVAQIGKLADFRVVGQTTDVTKLKALFTKRKPDVAVMELAPQESEFQIVEELKARDPGVTLIVLSDNPDLVYRKEWKKRGADFYFDTVEAVEFLPDLLSWKAKIFVKHPHA